jgi:hypothetical protein
MAENNIAWRRFPLYDYVRYPTAGTTQITFFNVPLGGTDPVSSAGKTMEQTNVQKSGQLGYPFVIHQLRLDVRLLPKARQPSAIAALTRYTTNDITDAANALTNLLGQGNLNIKIGQKSYYDINQPFRMAPAGFGVDLVSTTGAGASAPDQAVWVQQPQCKPYALTPSQFVAADQIISMTIDFPNATSPALTALIASADPKLEIGLILDGYAGFVVQ